MNYIRRNCKINVLGVEYPGYGINWDEGICTESRMVRDARLVLEFIRNKLKVDNRDIILFGRSMGTGVATTLACTMKVPPSLLVLT